jgi:hypothetical protein
VPTVGAKKGKYVYVKRRDGLYAKIRMFKKRDPNSPDAYIVTGTIVKKLPRKAKIIALEDLPEELRNKI